MAGMCVGACPSMAAQQPGRAQHARRGSQAAPASAVQRQPCWAQQRERPQRRAASQPCQALQVEAPSEAMAPEAAWSLLQEFTAKEARGLAQALLDSPDKRRRLRDALLVAAGAPHVPAGWNPAAASQPSAAAAATSSAAAAGAGTEALGVPEVLLGVVASDVRLAVRALRDYCQALGLPFRMPDSRVPGVAAAPAITGSVYIKYNSATGLCYATKYEGRDRGVLVQLGQQQLGHLPLGLHDEGMARPPPATLG